MPTALAPPQTHFNNKIIINQQHYFTDSIKIYQNGGQNSNYQQVPTVAGVANNAATDNNEDAAAAAQRPRRKTESTDFNIQ